MMKGADVPACEVVVDGRLRATGAGGVLRLRLLSFYYREAA